MSAHVGKMLILSGRVILRTLESGRERAGEELSNDGSNTFIKCRFGSCLDALKATGKTSGQGTPQSTRFQEPLATNRQEQ